jgi:hypothetical protein
MTVPHSVFFHEELGTQKEIRGFLFKVFAASILIQILLLPFTSEMEGMIYIIRIA